MSLLLIIEETRRRVGVSAHKMGRLLANDPRLVSDLRRGRCVGPALAGRISERLAALDAETTSRMGER